MPRSAGRFGADPARSIYSLAPYRLATVAGGCLVAFIWTIFPNPLTDRTWLRRDLSAGLYLLANFFSVVNQSLIAKLHCADAADEERSLDSPAHKLLLLRQKLFGKLTLLLPSLQAHAHFQRWEPNLGGRFPRETYEEIIVRCARISRYLALAGHTLSWPPSDEDPTAAPTADAAADALWLSTLGRVLRGLEPMQHRVISTLTLLSNSLLSGQSLPPFMRLPEPYELSRRLESLAAEGGGRLLDARNVEQRGFAEFAVLQVCATLIFDDLEGLVAAVTRLVGVVDFSFRVESSRSSLAGSEDGENGAGGEGEGKGKGKVE